LKKESIMNATIKSDETGTGGDSGSPLRYLSAAMVCSPFGQLDRRVLRNASNHIVGVVDGIVIDPSVQRVRYVVVQTCGSATDHRYLLPFESALIHLDPISRTLRMDVEAEAIDAHERF
jgi:hypothetical protein